LRDSLQKVCELKNCVRFPEQARTINVGNFQPTFDHESIFSFSCVNACEQNILGENIFIKFVAGKID
jgi:hypothetical protein